MNAFRILLVVFTMGIVGYTSVTISYHGWDLLSVFFGDMMTLTWPGQFNLDFSCFLILSGLWTAWKNYFTLPGILLGIVAIFFGMTFLAPYLLYLSYQTQGNLEKMLLR